MSRALPWPLNKWTPLENERKLRNLRSKFQHVVFNECHQMAGDIWRNRDFLFISITYKHFWRPGGCLCYFHWSFITCIWEGQAISDGQMSPGKRQLWKATKRKYSARCIFARIQQMQYVHTVNSTPALQYIACGRGYKGFQPTQLVYLIRQKKEHCTKWMQLVKGLSHENTKLY